jgi:hypothetical protein
MGIVLKEAKVLRGLNKHGVSNYLGKSRPNKRQSSYNNNSGILP